MYNCDKLLHNFYGVNIMHIAIDINTELNISSLTDLPKLKLLMENLKMKINKSELARKFNVDRRTISKYLDGYKPNMTRKKTSKIDAYYDIIKRLLSDESPQKFYYKRILWQYLKDNHGLNCSDSGFRAYISRKPEFQSYFESERKRKSQKEVVRFETSPAEQAQLDWKENIKFITKDGETIYVNVCVLLLAHSRFRTYHLSISKSQELLFSFLTDSFETIGGVPKTLVVDNMKSVMDEPRTRYQKGKVNEKFYQFSKDFNFEVRPCLAGRPETKAKVEAPMKFLDEIHAYQGQFNYEELHHFVQKLCNRINHSYHQGTGVIPILGLEKERNLLSALPSNRIRDFYRVKHTLVKVTPSNMVSYQSNQYSVPPGYIGKAVGLQVYDKTLYIYSNMNLIAQHQLSEKKLNYHPDHYTDLLSRQLPYKEKDEIEELALKNLEAINEVYNHEY